MDTTENTLVDKFTADAVKRGKLLALLDDPVMQEAMSIVDDEMRPRAGGTSDTNQPLSISKFHQSAGAYKYQSRLRELTKERVARKPVQVKGLAKTVDDLPDNLK